VKAFESSAAVKILIEAERYQRLCLKPRLGPDNKAAVFQ
jgi:hypothetical protein